MRITHLITGLDCHGAERALAQFLRVSNTSKYSHVVISMTEVGPVGKQLITAGIKVYALGMRRGVPSVIPLIRLIRLLRSLKPQVLHCWMYHANLLGLLVGRLTGVPKIIWGIRAANTQLSSYSRLTRSVIWLCARLSHVPMAIT